MPHKKRSPKSVRRTAAILLALVSVGAAVSPVAAASGLTAMDRGALAMIVAFGTLLLAIVFEVWRVTRFREQAIENRATQKWTNEHPES